jgi:hypothetical protein
MLGLLWKKDALDLNSQPTWANTPKTGAHFIILICNKNQHVLKSPELTFAQPDLELRGTVCTKGGLCPQKAQQ